MREAAYRGGAWELWRSWREFVRLCVQYWYWLVISGVGGVCGFITLVLDSRPATAAVGAKTPSQRAVNEPPVRIPSLVWLAVAAVGFIVAAFIAFHVVRRQRDARDHTRPGDDVAHIAAAAMTNPGSAIDYECQESSGAYVRLRIVPRQTPTYAARAPRRPPW
jgi:hypothetical protein